MRAMGSLASPALPPGIKMDRLTQLNAELAASVAWIEEARRTLAKAAHLAGESGGAEGTGDDEGPASMEVDGGGGDESAGPSASPSQGVTPEPDGFMAAALLAATEAEADTEAGSEGGGRAGRLGQVLPALGSLPPFVKPKRRGRQPKPKQKVVRARPADLPAPTRRPLALPSTALL